MSEEVVNKSKRTQALHDWVVEDVTSVAHELAEIGAPLKEEQIDAFRVYRAQCIVDRAAETLVRKQSEEAEQQLSDESWLNSYFKETLPSNDNDWLGLEHVQYIVSELGYQGRYATTIFDGLVRHHTRGLANRRDPYRTAPLSLGTVYRYKEDDPTRARILKERRLAIIPSKDKLEDRVRDGYVGAYLFKFEDVGNLLSSGEFYAGGEKTMEVIKAMGGWISQRLEAEAQSASD